MVKYEIFQGVINDNINDMEMVESFQSPKQAKKWFKTFSKVTPYFAKICGKGSVLKSNLYKVYYSANGYVVGKKRLLTCLSFM